MFSRSAIGSYDCGMRRLAIVGTGMLFAVDTHRPHADCERSFAIDAQNEAVH